MKTVLLSLAATGLLMSCAPMADEGGAPPPPMDGASNQCKAEQYQRFVGMNRSQLPRTPAGETWRVACTTCPVTMDYSARRLNIFYDQTTGIIREVKCG